MCLMTLAMPQGPTLFFLAAQSLAFSIRPARGGGIWYSQKLLLMLSPFDFHVNGLENQEAVLHQIPKEAKHRIMKCL